MVEREELRLVWPPDLFAAEGRALLRDPRTGYEHLHALMDEAFDGDRGSNLIAEIHAARPPLPPTTTRPGPGGGLVEIYEDGTQEGIKGGARVLVEELAANASGLPRWTRRKYFSDRVEPQPSVSIGPSSVRRRFARLIDALRKSGYFEDAFGSDSADRGADPDAAGQEYLRNELGTGQQLWPVTAHDSDHQPLPVSWADELLFDVIEALYEIVARPRLRTWHSWGAHWDHDDFSRAAGKAVYTWRVNQLLADSALKVRLRNDGEEAGHVVRVTGDDRDDLVDSALATPDPTEQAALEHAVRLFRGRNATRDEKRSAVVALAGVLEARRELIKEELLSADEGALFMLANKFDLRHRGEQQKREYDDAFLDWIFWWYIATIELTDRIAVGPAGRTAAE